MKIRIVKEQNLGSEFPGKEAGRGYTMSREIIDMLRSKVYPKLFTGRYSVELFYWSEVHTFRGKRKNEYSVKPIYAR